MVTLTFLIAVLVVLYRLTRLCNVPLPVRKLLTSSIRLLVPRHPPVMTIGNLPRPAKEQIAAAHRLLLRPTDRVPPVNIIGIPLKRRVVIYVTLTLDVLTARTPATRPLVKRVVYVEFTWLNRCMLYRRPRNVLIPSIPFVPIAFLSRTCLLSLRTEFFTAAR